jgi:hypothetical protein
VTEDILAASYELDRKRQSDVSLADDGNSIHPWISRSESTHFRPCRKVVLVAAEVRINHPRPATQASVGSLGLGL